MIQVENVANFLTSHQRWFDGPALKLLLAQVPYIISHTIRNMHCLLISENKAACFLISLLQLLIMDVFLGYR